MPDLHWSSSGLSRLLALSMALLLGSAAAASAGSGSWRTLAPIPAAGDGVIAPSVATVSTGEIVAAFGFDEHGRRTTRIYDIAKGEWRLASPGPRPHRWGATAVSRGRFLYAVGGMSTDGVISDLDRYDAVADRWTSLADMPTPRQGAATAIVGHHIYVIGGSPEPHSCDGQLRVVERYDIRTDTWDAVASIPLARTESAAVEVNGKVYVFGGCRHHPAGGGGLVILRRVDVYDPKTDSWTMAARLPKPRLEFNQVGVSDPPGPAGTVYVIGGWDASEVRGTVFIFDVATNSYSRGQRMPTPRAQMGVASFRGRIFTIGGSDPLWGTANDEVEVYRP